MLKVQVIATGSRDNPLAKGRVVAECEERKREEQKG